jgi:hypothetical protein
MLEDDPEPDQNERRHDDARLMRRHRRSSEADCSGRERLELLETRPQTSTIVFSRKVSAARVVMTAIITIFSRLRKGRINRRSAMQPRPASAEIATAIPAAAPRPSPASLPAC